MITGAESNTVHGSIFMALRRHVVDTHGVLMWDALLVEAGLRGKLYTSLSDYPDAELMALVKAAATGLDTDKATVLQGFGRSLVKDLVRTYGSLISTTWTCFDLLEHTESTIHAVVRSRHPGATPPVLRVERRGPEAVAITYASDRRLCALARGIVLGVGDHYGTALQVHEPQCRLKGAPECRLEVLPAWTPPQPREEVPATDLVA